MLDLNFFTGSFTKLNTSSIMYQRSLFRMAFKTFIIRIAAAAGHRKPNAPGHTESNSLELYLREFEVKENIETQENWIHQYKAN